MMGYPTENMSLDCYLDIETMPTADPAFIEEIAGGISPPKSYKKAETIAAWERDEKPALIEEALARTALDGAFGRVCAIGWACDDGPVEIWCGTDEHDVIRGFFEAVRRIEFVDGHSRDITWIGHNVHSFDLRFLWQRAVVLGLRMPGTLRIALNARPWGGLSGVLDTMTFWNPERDKRISLDRLCKVLGIPSPKAEMDGTMVCAAMQAGEVEKVREYVRGDINAVRAVHQRLTLPPPL